MSRRKTIAMLIAVTVPDYMTVAQAKKEVRSRIDDLCGYHNILTVYDRRHGTIAVYPEDSDVKLRKIGWAKSLGLGVKKLVLSAPISRSMVSF